jgi:hypothetical protein
MLDSITNLTGAIFVGGFILLVLIIVTLGRRIKRIRVSAGVVTVLVEFGLTPEELEAEVMSNLVKLRAIATTDAEFWVIAAPIISKYLANTNNVLDSSIYPRKTIRGSVEGIPGYLATGPLPSPPPPGPRFPRSSNQAAPPPPSR